METMLNDFQIILASIRVIDVACFVTASYFMYPFGYNHYRKCCGPCNAGMYKCCEWYNHKRINNCNGINGVYHKLDDQLENRTVKSETDEIL